MLLQTTVFLQPFLPQKLQFSLVCVTISELKSELEKKQPTHHHATHNIDSSSTSNHMHDHQLDHKCMFCTVYSHVISHVKIDLKSVLQRIQIRLISFQNAFKHVYFVLHRLFLMPQGRAPPSLLI